MESIATIAIEGLRWRDGFGNSYHTVRIEIEYASCKRVVITSPRNYGYGYHYNFTAGEMLASLGLTAGADPDDGYAVTAAWRRLLGPSGFGSSVRDVSRRRDLHSAGRLKAPTIVGATLTCNDCGHGE